jgi:hypothetical protein
MVNRAAWGTSTVFCCVLSMAVFPAWLRALPSSSPQLAGFLGDLWRVELVQPEVPEHSNQSLPYTGFKHLTFLKKCIIIIFQMLHENNAEKLLRRDFM